ncbi:hypothetical protein [Hyalangium minutum]|uniref:Uncharacterized protein n=1 Tax=Hyalangium minutum TaxID=394096 RepID=A0A085WUS5_9BACT|nr:hypothetical protein [Hyalangium minutum]KFE71438.1 hypothetical protein DB31_3568 [Hyalangium minutum]
MKTLTVALLFILSLVTLFTAARADALSQPAIQPRLARPVPLPEGDDDKKDDKKKGDEEDEEEYRALSPRAALELVDPGLQDDFLRLRLAARRGM